MNDRFKFRAWNKASKEMYNVIELGFMRDTMEMGYICLDKPDNDVYGIAIESVEEYILMQCTGKKDKNGRLIYEGDICSDNNGELYQAYYYEQDTAICLKGYDGGIMRVCPDVIDLEVIGNIYENPELLEV